MRRLQSGIQSSFRCVCPSDCPSDQHLSNLHTHLTIFWLVFAPVVRSINDIFCTYFIFNVSYRWLHSSGILITNWLQSGYKYQASLSLRRLTNVIIRPCKSQQQNIFWELKMNMKCNLQCEFWSFFLVNLKVLGQETTRFSRNVGK